MKHKIITKLSAALLAAATAFCAAITPASAGYNKKGATQAEAFTAPYQTYWLSCEMQKFPAGKYWNNRSNPESYTSTPCTKHHINGPEKVYTGECCYISDDANFEYGTDMLLECDRMLQCGGFARKLAQDFFFGHIDNAQMGYHATWIRYHIQSRYSPRFGDQVRIKGSTHSIFITEVKGNNIKFADCNWNDDCGIRWNVSATLINNGKYIKIGGQTYDVNYIFRPVMVGDVDGDSEVTLFDLNGILELIAPQTYGAFEYQLNPHITDAAADLNNDGNVTMADYTLAYNQYHLIHNDLYLPDMRYVSSFAGFAISPTYIPLV